MTAPDERAIFAALEGHPDPEFAKNLLDQLLEQIADSPSHPSHEDVVPPGEATDGRREEPVPELEIVMLKPNPLPNRHVGTWVLGAAAALIVIVGGVVALTRSGDDSIAVVTDEPAQREVTTDEPAADVAEADPEPDPQLDPSAETSASVVIALNFIEARAAYDGEAARGLVADDATIAADAEWVTSADEYLLLDDWERATGMSFLEPDCQGGSPGRVRCTYSMETTMTQALGLGTYANSFLFEIADGKIQQVNHARNNDDAPIGENHYSDVYFSHFKPWVGANHPNDNPLMFNTGDDGVFNADAPFITTESITLWKSHVAEFVESLTE